MNCPSCRRGLPAGPHESCPFCGTRLAAPIEGALAAEPAPVTPNPREAGPIREIPGLRKRERTWKDEVRERVRERRERRSEGGELPLFPDVDAEEEEESPAPVAAEAAPPATAPASPAAAVPESSGARFLDDLAGPMAGTPSGPRELGEEPAEEPAEDLPLHRPDAGETTEPSAAPDVPPVERPAMPLERFVAGAVDLAILVAVWSAVVYLASRAAGVTVGEMQPAWPWLAAYLAALGLLYAGYFTGTTGQTLGKMVRRLHVFDLAGGPPGHLRAVARALLGSLGVLLAGAGLLPMLLDPARRALHDRLLRTRVVKL